MGVTVAGIVMGHWNRIGPSGSIVVGNAEKDMGAFAAEGGRIGVDKISAAGVRPAAVVVVNVGFGIDRATGLRRNRVKTAHVRWRHGYSRAKALRPQTVGIHVRKNGGRTGAATW